MNLLIKPRPTGSTIRVPKRIALISDPAGPMLFERPCGPGPAGREGLQRNSACSWWPVALPLPFPQRGLRSRDSTDRTRIGLITRVARFA
jgi:hypothetical protein